MQIPSSLHKQAPSLTTQIDQVSRELALEIPEELIELYEESNGLEGTLGSNGYIQVWSLDRIVRRNRALNVQEILPGAFLFASNGGSFYYGYNTNPDKKGYFMVDPISMTKEIFEGGNTLQELFDRIGKSLLIKK